MAKKRKVTLLAYWDKLSPKQIRIIHDLIRVHSFNRQGINMGLLPFIPVDEVVTVLRRYPMSGWTVALYVEENNTDPEFYYYHPEASQHTPFAKSKRWDEQIYDEIIAILTPPEVERPSHLATQLEQWREQSKEEKNA